jgi:hypothetical protein
VGVNTDDAETLYSMGSKASQPHPWIRLFAFLSFALEIAALVACFRRAVAVGKSRLESEKPGPLPPNVL